LTDAQWTEPLLPDRKSATRSGVSRGGLTTKLHLAADGRCRPLCFHLTSGQADDAPAFEDVMGALRVPRAAGRPRTRPVLVLADRAYSSRAIREHLRRRGIRTVIPQPSNQVANRRRKGRRGGRPPAFDREADALADALGAVRDRLRAVAPKSAERRRSRA
jgi:hypothetical protein